MNVNPTGNNLAALNQTLQEHKETMRMNAQQAQEGGETSRLASQEYGSENVNMQAGMKALSEAVKNDPVANFISFLA